VPRPRLLARFGELAVEGAGLLVAVPLWVWWAVWKGGYPPAVFLVAIGYLTLAAVSLYLFAPRPRLAGASAWALGALAVLSAWTLASLLWADDRGAAEVASARQVLLLASFALPALWPPTARALLAGVAAVPLVALCGAVSALGGALADAGTLVDGRLAGPTGYANASAALMAIGILPALVLGSRREVAIPLRAFSLAAAGALLGTFVLTQSRGGLGALALVLLLAFLFVPGRLRLLIPVVLVAVAAGAALDPLLEVRSVAVGGGDVEASLRDAIAALLTSTVVLAAIAAVYAAADSRIEIGAKTAHRASAAVAVALGATALFGAVALLASGPDVGGWVSDRAEDFKTPDYAQLESEPSRFTGDLGSNRYDYWRVSVDVFAEEPLTGSGAGNFIAPYLERRQGEKSTIYAHSIWLGSLAELGAAGLLALVGFVVALSVALARSARRLGPGRWIVVAAALPLAYVLVHGSFDWITAFPVVSAPALALAAAAAGVLQAGKGPPAPGRRSASLAAVLALVLATVLAAPLLVAARLSDRGVTTWPANPSRAIADLERAAGLDPLAAAPYVRLGVVAIELDRPALARRAFDSALQRDESAWYPELQLGLVAAGAGHRERALRHLEVALARNPREPEARFALRSVREGHTPDPRAVQRRVLESDD
jgi:O-antigen ligase